MGHGSYTAADWQKLKNSRNLGSGDNVFANNHLQDKYNSKFIEKRESFDSEDSPESTPVILGFDCTGSMGWLANEIAQNSLNETITKILSTKVVTDPHMMCAAFADYSYPLQVTQFEADIRVVEQLLELYLYGGNQYSYDALLWYFAAKHTKTDCWDKRHKKGILIGIGDEVCGRGKYIIPTKIIKKVFDDDIDHDLSEDDIWNEASQKYEIVHIVVGNEHRVDGDAYKSWKEAYPGRVARLHEKDIKLLSDVILAIMRLINGEDRETILNQIEKEDERDIVRKAIEDFN